MKQKKIFDKVMKIFAVMVFILSMCFSQKYANNVEAWDNSTPHEFTRIKQIDYPWWWSSKIASAKKWSTYMCKYDNKYAYCLEASKKSPSSKLPCFSPKSSGTQEFNSTVYISLIA